MADLADGEDDGNSQEQSYQHRLFKPQAEGHKAGIMPTADVSGN